MATAPGFRKNQIVTPIRDGVFGSRPATRAEQDAWYADRYAAAPHDSAGESWIHSGYTSVPLQQGVRYRVLEGRCTACVGWTVRGGLCTVGDGNGTECNVDRRDMMVVS